MGTPDSEPGSGISPEHSRRRGILEFGGRFDHDPLHGRCVAKLALALFHASRTVHRLDDRAAELLEYAALLHDIGLSISHSKHHRHSQYLVLNSALKDFAAEEIAIIGALARFHRGTPARNSSPELAQFAPAKRKVVMVLAAILRVADGLDRSHRGVVRRIDLARDGGVWRARIYFREHDGGPELWAASRKADAWARCFGAPLVLVRAADESAITRL